MFFATGAIAGIPLLSGFFSKDEILFEGARHSWLLYGVGAVTAAMTAFYMTRLMYKTFHGSPKTTDAAHAHESPAVMWLPVAILGFLAIVGGYVGLPAITGQPNLMELFLKPSTASGAVWDVQPVNAVSEGLLLLVSSLIAIVFVVGTILAYKPKDGRDLVLSAEAKKTNAAYRLLLNKWYVDEIYNAIFVGLGRKFADIVYRVFDLGIVDGVVRGVGWLATQVGAGCRGLQNGYVRSYAFTILIFAIVLVVAAWAGFHTP
jgi:NADH-quinone oxidoreductase subunit L